MILIVWGAFCGSPSIAHGSEYYTRETTKGHLRIPESPHAWERNELKSEYATQKRARTKILTLHTHPIQQCDGLLQVSRCCERERPVLELPFAHVPPGLGSSSFNSVEHSPSISCSFFSVHPSFVRLQNNDTDLMSAGEKQIRRRDYDIEFKRWTNS